MSAPLLGKRCDIIYWLYIGVGETHLNISIIGLNVDKSSSAISASQMNTCQLEDNPCGPHGACRPGHGWSYTCYCKPDYEEEYGVCVPDDDIGLKIALPIVLLLLTILFIYVLCKHSGKSAKNYRTENVESGWQSPWDVQIAGKSNASFEKVSFYKYLSDIYLCSLYLSSWQVAASRIYFLYSCDR